MSICSLSAWSRPSAPMPDSLDSDASTYPASEAHLLLLQLSAQLSGPSALPPTDSHPRVHDPQGSLSATSLGVFLCFAFESFWFCCFEQSPAPPQML